MRTAPAALPAPLVPGQVPGFQDVEAAVAAIAAGRSAVVVDDEDRENEGDLVAAARLAGPETVGQMVRRTSGLLCAPLTAEAAQKLELPPMHRVNEDPKGTAYTVSCDAAHGTTTGISAAERALTARVLADPASGAADLTRPGHLLPLVAVPGGVRQRPGHTEAAVELAALAGLPPVGLIGEVVHDDGSMMRLPDLQLLAAADGYPLLTIERLVAYLDARDAQRGGAPDGRVGATGAAGTTGVAGATAGRAGARSSSAQVAAGEADAAAQAAAAAHPRTALPDLTERMLPEIQTVSEPVALPTDHGTFTAQVWRVLGTEHLTLSAPVSAAGRGSAQSSAAPTASAGPAAGSATPLVRVHSECLTGDVLGSHRCDCGEQLDLALARIAAEGGTLVYVRDHEGRGIGLLNKLRAYHLQEQGADTIDANEALGLPAEARDYAPAAAILAALDIESLRLLTNNPAKVEALTGLGLDVTATEPVEVPPRPENQRYLATKRDRMQHRLDHLDGSTVL